MPAPRKGSPHTFYVSLVSQADTRLFQANPTLAAGDVKVATDDGAPANATTLPAVDADFTDRVKVSLSAAEMNGDNVTVIFSDAAGAEWCDLTVNVTTEPVVLRDVAATVEHQRGAHTHQPIGRIFYVDPTNGDTHANGNRGGLDDPYAGVQDCHDNAVTDSNHDMIILLSGASGGATTLTENVTISKRYTFIRGPGRDFIWTRSGAGDTITVTADGVEIAGCQVNTAATGSGVGIAVDGADFFRAYRLWINDTQGHGIQLTDCENAVIRECHFHSSGQSGAGHGLVMDAGTGESGNNIIVEGCHFHGVAGDAVRLNPSGTGTINNAIISYNHFLNSSGWGVNIVDAGVDSASVTYNVFGGNTSGTVAPNGTGTIESNNEQWAKHSIATEARLAELDAANLPSDVDDILDDTGTSGVVLAAGSVTAAAIAADAIDADALAADAVTEIAAGISVPTAAAVADAVWDEAVSGHTTSGTTGSALNRIGSGQITAISTVSQAGDIPEIIGGADYLDADGYAFPWTNEDGTWPDLTDATVTWHGIAGNGQTKSISGSVVTPTGTQKVMVEMTSAETGDLEDKFVGDWSFLVWATLASESLVPLVSGRTTVKSKPGPA